MAAKQVFSVPSYNYVVVDNVSAQTFPVISCATHIGYDTMSVTPGFGAAAFQGTQPGTELNGSIPDFVEDQKAIGTGLVLVSLGYLNPS
jgi:hypothetical protein